MGNIRFIGFLVMLALLTMGVAGAADDALIDNSTAVGVDDLINESAIGNEVDVDEQLESCMSDSKLSVKQDSEMNVDFVTKNGNQVISVEGDDFWINEYDKYFGVHFPNKVSGNLTLFIDDKFISDKSITSKNHYFYLNSEEYNLASGRHDWKIRYSGDGDYESKSVNGTFNLNFITFDIPNNLTPRDNIYFSFVSDAKCNIMVFIDDRKYRESLIDYNSENKIITESFSLDDGLDFGKHNYKIVCIDEKYGSFEKTGQFNFQYADWASGKDGNFSDLNILIRNCEVGGTVKLEKDYIFDNFSDRYSYGIDIDKPLTIDGQGHIIDARNQTRIFQAFNNVTLKNIIFKNGYSSYGGAVYSGSGNLFIINSTFKNNLAGDGGAIYAVSGILSVENSSFIDNHLTNLYYAESGGAIYASNDVVIFNSTFVNNTANSGGAIHCIGHNITLMDSFFRNNAALLYTGGSIVSTADVHVANSVFENNHAPNYGGAIFTYGEGSGKVQVVNSNFTNNTSNHYAGAISSATGVNILNSTFKYNFAVDDGGAISAEGDVLFLNSVFINNSASNYGIQVLMAVANNVSIFNSTFIGNYGGVGAIWLDGNIYVSNSSFTDNLLCICGACNVFIDNSNFTNNHDEDCIIAISGDVSLINSNFTGNIAENTNGETYSGTLISGNEIHLINSTFLNNKAKSNSAFDGKVSITNSKIIEDNIDVTQKYIKSDAGSNNPAVQNSNVKTQKSKSTLKASKKTFKAKARIKKYSITLKSGKKAIKKVRVYLIIKGKKYKKTFKAKTNKKGRATFKIKKLTKKGSYNAKIKFKGNKNYKSTNIKLKITITNKKCKIRVVKAKSVKKAKDGYVDASQAYEYLNKFRAQKGVWYWNKDGKTKTYFNTNDDNQLKPLQRDAELEKIAKIRAKEISEYFSHDRPDGTDGSTIYPDYFSGENIAAGQSTGKEVIEDWKENNEKYSGQGHRRNMLNMDFDCVGIAAYQKNGVIYWVQAFGIKNEGTIETVYGFTYM